MTRLPFHLRFASVALVALLGTLLAGAEATACGTAELAAAPAACCAHHAATACPCCGSQESAAAVPAAPVVRLAVTPGRALFTAPASPCECRASDPASPASRPEPGPAEGRPDETSGFVLDLPKSARPDAWAAPTSLLLAAPHAYTPLVLLTAHLNI
jgi:hypothetical protein